MTATLVTGAAGFIGLNLVEVLLSEGNDVVAFDTRALPARAMDAFSALPGHLVTVEGDVTDAASLVRAFTHPVGRILHAAAITSGPEREMAMPGRIVAVNVIGTVNVAKAAERHRVRRLLLVSSAAVYGPLPDSETMWCEDSPLAPGSLYGVTKLAAELTAQRLAALYGLDLKIGRLGWIFGPWEHRSGARDTMSPVYQLTTAAFAGKSTNLTRRDRRMWTYSRDAAGALVLLLTNDARQPIYNIASGVRIDLMDWGTRLGEKVPGFQCGIGNRSADVTVDLFSDMDPPGMTTARLDGELKIAWRDENAAFEDYCRWLTAHPWPCKDELEGEPP
jgi:UDP-glucose 4-epimerase